MAKESSTIDSEGRKVLLETDKRGRVVAYQLSVIQPFRHYSRRITTKDLPYQGTWEYVLQPVGQRTKLTVTEDGEIDNPLFRFVARFGMGYSRTATAYLVALGHACGEEVRPEVKSQRREILRDSSTWGGRTTRV